MTDELSPDSLNSLIAMGQRLWPDSTPEDYQRVLDGPNQTAFLARGEGGVPMGFVIVSLRHDYVEGTATSPVGYLEGIYVEPEFRRQGWGRTLTEIAEEWARQRGCSEMGSDTELENTASQAFHGKSGFREVNRIVSFVKKLDSPG